ncbi:DUF3710 domain-containing protein [Gordonia sp. HY442]|uniref:DUF3710 domain-containing protein n=1 Tax=Gordonia zhenghanii TaxID=2911516 RepID=UPI001F40CBCC|nr:DUF3710 domain-containing protein [Gordonia zhenghanii]MCF8606280.1 DUF3710 domain-containing protein [Gordonia zhenghanii]MCF8606868.1 DUF3710 domain-containing protein [Gordonia zhenghanii]
MSETNKIGEAGGPYDIDDLENSPEELANSHLDLGSVLMPVVEGGQVTVEMSADHTPEAVYLVTPVGRIGIHAFAAPRSGGLWREVVRELAESLRSDGAMTSIEDGHWGREVVARVTGGVHRFIGVDGARWMVRCVASGPEESDEQLGQLARAVLAETVVRRGDQPYPPRDVLPIVLPPVLAEQVAAAQREHAAEESTEPTSQPLTDAPSMSRASASASTEEASDEVHPRGAVAQSASATVFSEAPDVLDDDPTALTAEAATDEDGAAVDGDPAFDGAFDGEAAVDDPEAESAPSQGSALSRLRNRRRNR